mmetsp:Transcript_546/g.1461  ORF Transcript_546/g.1461 Transcript_546/m.1461 type:complete len:270 (+) Transcript_546:824-1633(+)
MARHGGVAVVECLAAAAAEGGGSRPRRLGRRAGPARGPAGFRRTLLWGGTTGLLAWSPALWVVWYRLRHLLRGGGRSSGRCCARPVAAARRGSRGARLVRRGRGFIRSYAPARDASCTGRASCVPHPSRCAIHGTHGRVHLPQRGKCGADRAGYPNRHGVGNGWGGWDSVRRGGLRGCRQHAIYGAGHAMGDLSGVWRHLLDRQRPGAGGARAQRAGADSVQRLPVGRHEPAPRPAHGRSHDSGGVDRPRGYLPGERPARDAAPSFPRA